MSEINEIGTSSSEEGKRRKATESSHGSHRSERKTDSKTRKSKSRSRCPSSRSSRIKESTEIQQPGNGDDSAIVPSKNTNSSEMETVRSSDPESSHSRTSTSKHKHKHGHRSSKSPHRSSSRGKFDLVPSRPSRTRSPLRDSKRTNKKRGAPMRSKSLDSNTDLTTDTLDEEVKRQERKSSARTRTSRNSHSLDLSDQETAKIKEKHYRQSLRLRFSHEELGDDKRVPKPKRTRSADTDDLIGTAERAKALEKNHRRSAAAANLTDTDRRIKAAANHGYSSDDDLAILKSKQKSRVLRVADASMPPGAYTFSSNEDATDSDHAGDDNANGKRRSAPTAGSAPVSRPGAHAVSMNSIEPRGSAGRSRASMETKLRLLDEELGVDSPPGRTVGIDMAGHLSNSEAEIVVDPEELTTSAADDGVPVAMALQASTPDVENPEMETGNGRLRRKEASEKQGHQQPTTNQNDATEGTSGGQIVESAPAEVDNEKTEEEKKRRGLLCAGVMCLLCVILGVIGAIFASKESASIPASIAESLSSRPSSSPSSMPSLSPTITMLYDSPSEEDCQAVESGEPIEGQETMITITLEAGLEITLNDEVAQDEWVDQLQQSVVAYLVPYLVGCTDDRDPSDNNRYVFGNANATIEYDDADTCQKETDLPCYPVALNLDLAVKDDENINSLIFLLEDLIRSDGSGNSLTDRLGLSDDFQEVILEDVTNKPPTPFPSFSPTDVPNLVPSSVPSSPPSASLSTPSPSWAPVVGPTTNAPTRSPTVLPTQAPTTPSPTRTPSKVPTTQPTTSTKAPTLGVTLGPTLTPTKNPTTIPSQAPTTPVTVPTPPPTMSPTESPSESPTAVPTIVPTLKPSSTPTPVPTPAPTLVPTPAPTPAPTTSPTAVPTPVPTPVPTTTPVSTPIPTPNPTPVPTPNPTPGPTLSTTPAPTVGSAAATYCCSDNFKDCNIMASWCNANQQQCNSCNGNFIVEDSCPAATGIEKWGDCTNNVNDCCAPLRCVTKSTFYKQCLE